MGFARTAMATYAKATHMHWTAIGIAIVLAAATAVGGVSPALACACCADPGARFESDQTFGDDSLGAQAIGKLTPAGAATLYTTSAEWDEQIRGIDNPARSERYDVTLERDDKTWALKFNDGKGNSGAVVIALPRVFRLFAADPTPGAVRNTSQVTLYKELRVTGQKTGLGIFKLKAGDQAKATLIFHGRGNGCTSAEQFTHWTLDVTGPETRYRFFGELVAVE